MDQLKGRSSVLMIVVVVIAGGIFYLINGGSSGSSDGTSSVKKPHDAVEMTVTGGVRTDGTFRGRVERTGRHAEKGVSKIGTYDMVDLRLADLEPIDLVRDECWAEEGEEAIDELVTGRIYVDPKYIEKDSSGRFLVYVWNRDDVFVQEQLLTDGDVRLFNGLQSEKFGGALGRAEEEASSAQRGLWKACGDA